MTGDPFGILPAAGPAANHDRKMHPPESPVEGADLLMDTDEDEG